jgi:hypothetical protein
MHISFRHICISESHKSNIQALNRVDISRCVEKPDFQNMVIARLIFGDRSPIKRQALLYYPEWALHIGRVHFLCSLLMPYWTSLCVLRRTCRQE